MTPINAPAFLVLLLVVGGLAVSVLSRQRKVQNTAAWQEVDLRALARLLDRDDDRFLTERLPLTALWSMRWKRAIAARDYLSRLGHNARFAIAVSRSHPQLAPETAAEIRDKAVSLQIEVNRLYLRTWAAVLLPVSCDLRTLTELTAGLAKVPSFMPAGR
jgi:hypothetical protein